MKPVSQCPFGRYENGKIRCLKVNGLCPNVRYRPCVGWYVHTEYAKDCPKRRE